MSKQEAQFRFRPIRGRVIVEAIEDPDIQNGIHVLDYAKELPKVGIVKAVGKGNINKDGKEEPIPLRPGDKIYFHHLAGQSIDLDEKKYLLMEEEKVLGVVS